MTSTTTTSKRREQDVLRLMMSKAFKVEMYEPPPPTTSNTGAVPLQEFHVEFHGPKQTAYEDGVWRVRVVLPREYPYKSPSIGFIDPIFHPNIDLGSGSVCLDVINQAWTPMYSLLNIFEQFLPQLLTYPNPSDPLNPVAAALMLRDPQAFETRARDFVKQQDNKRNGHHQHHQHHNGSNSTGSSVEKKEEEEGEVDARKTHVLAASAVPSTAAGGDDMLGDFEL